MTKRSEFQIISDLFAPLARSAEGAYGLKDDAAAIEIPDGRKLVVTADAIVSGVHFLPDDPADLVARKLIRVNLSDLAAMGANPLGFLLTCAFPADVSDHWITRFAAGLAEDVSIFGIPLLGGDTVATPGPASFTITALGTVSAGGILLRSTAMPGDRIVVTGTIGDGALGLLAAKKELGECISQVETAWLADRYRLPQPRLSVPALLGGGVRAAMDISDGLLQDLGHICQLSKVRANVSLGKVPVSGAARACLTVNSAFYDHIMTGGDDYELLLAVDPAFALPPDVGGIPLTVIGCFEEGSGCHVTGISGRTWQVEKTGFKHF